MGRPKGMLQHPSGAGTFAGHIITHALSAGLAPVLVVSRPGDDELREEVARVGGAFLVNPDPDRGQLSSLVVAIEALPLDVDAAIVLPVDIPLISAVVIRQIITAAANSDLPMVRAIHRGRHGHPVLFKRTVFDELRNADPLVGAKAVVNADPDRVVNVDVGEPGVTFDVDTPDDYRRLMDGSVGKPSTR